MSREVVFAVFATVSFIAAAAFAGLFAWQYLENDASVPDSKDKPAVDVNDTNGCPYYPQPQKVDFSKDKAFAELFAWLDSYVNSTVDENIRPSVSANLVYLNEIVWSGYYGKLSKEIDKSPDGDTIYRIGSISKIFPVLFLFKLWEDEELDLYDRVSKYAPDFTLQPQLGTTDDINLIDIASQISGLQSSLPFSPLSESAIIFNGTIEDALELMRDQTLVSEPRTSCVYSNFAYALLGSILARNFTDRNFTGWAEENVVDALGLTNTGFSYTKKIMNKMATGYLPDGKVAPVYEMLWYSPAGNYYSTSNDLAKLSMSFLETSKTILKHETLLEMMRPRKTCRHGYLANLTGSPWEMNVLHDNLIVRKDGGVEGYASTMALVPDLKLSFSVLMSGVRGEDVAREVLNRAIPVFRDALRRLEQEVNPTPDPEKYTGIFSYYGLQTETIKIGKDGVLLMEDPKQPARYNTSGLSYVSESIFRLTLLGGEFPCIGTLDAQNGVVVHFKNFTNGKYNEFDIPERYVFGFKRT